MQRIRIATRASLLALWQAEYVACQLRTHYPTLVTELVPMTTLGDQLLGQPLSTIGGKGLFLKELEIALQEQRADIAVHSFKDVPMDVEPGFSIGAILPRANPFDAFVSNRYRTLADLPSEARVGTSSLRRKAQLRAIRPDLKLLDLRGNINTRLAKLDADNYDGIILACAGLERLGLNARIRCVLQAPDWLPAVAQGAIAIEHCTPAANIAQLLVPLNDEKTARCVNAERAMNRYLHGSCQVPVAAYCIEGTDGDLTLDGLVGDVATGTLVRAYASGNKADAEALGIRVAKKLLDDGAGQILHTATG